MKWYHHDPISEEGGETLRSLLSSQSVLRLFFSGLFALTVFSAGCIAITLSGRSHGYDWPVFDVVYFVLITMSTVGYGETLPGMEELEFVRITTMIIIVGGMGAMVLFASNITAFFVEGDLQNLWKGRRFMKDMDEMHGHVVIAGVGETGRHAAKELLSNGIPFVAIDVEPSFLDRVATMGAERGWRPPTVLGDATMDEVLEAANIRTARGIMSCLPNDHANLFTVISARELNSKARILSRMIDEGSRKKMMRAGADGLVSPNQIGGLRLASEMTRPAVVTFLDEMRRDTNRNVRIEEICLSDATPVAGSTLAGSGLRNQTNALVLAIRNADGDYAYNPSPDTLLNAGDTIVVLADRDEVQKVREICGDDTTTIVPR